MKMRSLAPVLGAALAFGMIFGAAAQSDTPPDAAGADQSTDVLPVPTPQVEVDGVQTSSDDARLPGEDEEFIVNDGFGD